MLALHFSPPSVLATAMLNGGWHRTEIGGFDYLGNNLGNGSATIKVTLGRLFHFPCFYELMSQIKDLDHSISKMPSESEIQWEKKSPKSCTCFLKSEIGFMCTQIHYKNAI